MITASDNFKTVVEKCETLRVNEKNTIFRLHNIAEKDEVYGDKLFLYLMALSKLEKLKWSQVEHIYILSVDWPRDFKCEIM